MGKGVASSLVIAGIGIFFLIYSFQYDLGTLDSPGEAVFPLLVAIAVVAMAGWLLLANILTYRVQRQGGERNSKGINWGSERKIVALVVLNILVLWGMEFLGFFTSSFILVCLCCKLLGVREWSKAIGIALGAVLGAYLIFAFWLQVSFPRGLFI
ncbi:Tripartite tricarboxylate transporter TctB family protein [Thermanaeromonas toyohensis ToBE]|uniref:Tripartite tricarboxylate transporter TctB family protein n=1 Tax=Thermanaeromonas toyohensis ToBE TaxID=698762 RepID=A0A1W1VBC1_9FIRM|nr:tripartite tricarboxylate transporter TctB family protein [Thermanaeromonas toyohensis]SMB90586.1 Tripartite tricarboxylate transporter TctB family protein [Thermanaeromonas toyohensis ToBE]